jgi:putative restriction endonuclease
MTTHSQILQQFAAIKTWSRGAARAPHKPLLLLLALGRVQRGGADYILYDDVDKRLGALLRDFGGSAKSDGTQYPFSRLRNDGLWEFDRQYDLPTRKSNTDPKKSALRDQGVAGGFRADLQAELRKSPRLVVEIAQSLLDTHFASSMHEDILSAVGVDCHLSETMTKRVPRDPNFRKEVLRAYAYQCAVCGFDVRLDDTPVGLEAAHIQWHSHLGPDRVENGMCMCPIHHKSFDRGLFTVQADSLRVALSDLAHGGEAFQQWFVDYEGHEILHPRIAEHRPKGEYLEWHREQVFRSTSSAG